MKAKYFFAGFAAALAMGTVSVTASNLRLFGVTDNSQVKIAIDGEVKELPEDMHILNYKGFNYTPVRFIAEALGAEVIFDAETNSADFVWQEPETEIIYYEPSSIYNDAPLNYRTDAFNITLDEISNFRSIEAFFTFTGLPSGAVDILYEDAYAELGNEKVAVDLTKSYDYRNSLNRGERRNIVFQPVGNTLEKSDKVKIILPIKVTDAFNGAIRVYNLCFRVNLE